MTWLASLTQFSSTQCNGPRLGGRYRYDWLNTNDKVLKYKQCINTCGELHNRMDIQARYVQLVSRVHGP